MGSMTLGHGGRSVLFVAVLSSLLAATGCRSSSAAPAVAPAPLAGPVDSAPTVEAAAPAKSGESGLSPEVEGRARGLLEEYRVTENRAKGASRMETSIAQRLVSELRHDEALSHLNRALRLDPHNEKARGLLREVLFLEGDRGSEVGLLAQEVGQLERVRRQQQVRELQHLYQDGQALLEAGKAREAEELFDRLLDRLDAIESARRKAP